MVNTKTNYHKSPLEFLIFVLEGALHEDGDGFPLTGCVQVQQFLEGFCGQLQLLAHLLVIVGNGLLYCS